MIMKTNTFDIMAGKNEKVDFLSEIGSMVKNQKEENQILRRKKAENKANEPMLDAELEKDEQQPVVDTVEVKEAKKTKGRPKQILKVERVKPMKGWLDVNTHKMLGRIKV